MDNKVPVESTISTRAVQDFCARCGSYRPVLITECTDLRGLDMTPAEFDKVRWKAPWEGLCAPCRAALKETTGG